ncbi:MAG: choloylglycine hydrolase, partial [Agathobacter rectalis]
YDNSQITAVDMNRENLDEKLLIRYPVITEGKICWQN